MIILRNRTTIAHLRFSTRNTIKPYTKRTLISKNIIMDSGNNQQKKEVCNGSMSLEHTTQAINSVANVEFYKGEKQFSIQPINDNAGVNPKFAAHQAHPGPAVAKNMPPEQGTKEERQARKEELNK